MKTEKLLELGFKKRNLWSGYDDYYLEKEGLGFTCVFKKDTEEYDQSFIQNEDAYRHMKSKDDFEKVLSSNTPWKLALEIGDR